MPEFVRVSFDNQLVFYILISYSFSWQTLSLKIHIFLYIYVMLYLRNGFSSVSDLNNVIINKNIQIKVHMITQQHTVTIYEYKTISFVHSEHIF